MLDSPPQIDYYRGAAGEMRVIRRQYKQNGGEADGKTNVRQ